MFQRRSLKTWAALLLSATLSCLFSACVLGDKPDIPSASMGGPGDGDGIDLGGENNGKGGSCSSDIGPGGGSMGGAGGDASQTNGETSCAP